MIDLLPAENIPAPNLSQLFGRDALLHVDLGCGDGSLLRAMAVEHPEINFLGTERLLRRVRSSDKKAADLPNMRIIRAETLYVLERLLAPESVDAFYLLFPDPWPKRRHHRRRIVTAEFLGRIWTRLTSHGSLFMATDHDDYFAAIRKLLRKSSNFALASAEWKLPATTFEQKFIGAGTAIHRLELRKVSPVT
ncbi:MAG TPA: tRNA (guanosine(46)-N7)-methyltransferase TrmB [Chthoniobacterales bacterium]